MSRGYAKKPPVKAGDNYDLETCGIVTWNYTESERKMPASIASHCDSPYSKTPWRKDCDWSKEGMQNLRDSLVAYMPASESNIKTANILLIGQIGAGKSSYFNAVNSIFRGKISSKAMSGSLEHSVTTDFRKYSVQDSSSGQNLKFRLCDTRGFEEDYFLSGQEITYILGGNVPDRYQFNPAVPFSNETFGYIKNPSLTEIIHCVAFVIDGSSIDVMPEKIKRHLKDLRCQMIQRSLPQLILMTKIDKICSDVDNDVSNTYKSRAVKKAVDKVADIIGIPRGYVLPIKNYEIETHLENNIDILILDALQQAINFADDYIEEQLEKMAALKKEIDIKKSL